MIASELGIGSKVRYQPDHYSSDKWENGIVKEIPSGMDDWVRVVYNCNNDWEHAFDYTSALTRVTHLKKGWR